MKKALIWHIYGKIGLKEAALYSFSTICIISSLAGYAADSTIFSDTIRILLKAVVYLLATVVILYVIKIKKKIKTTVLAILIYWISIHIHTYTNQALGLITLLLILVYFTFDLKELVTLFRFYKKWVLVMSVFGIVAYTAYVLHIPLPHQIVPYYATHNNIYNLNYVNYYIGYLYENSGFVRLCGFFNEPGYFGTVLAFIICAEDINLRKRKNQILFLSGILTFSVAFIVIQIAYLVIRHIKDIRLIAGAILFIIITVFIIPNIHFENTTLELQRLKLELLLSGSTLRTTQLFDVTFEHWLISRHRLFGYGAGYTDFILLDDIAGSSSIKRVLIDHGIVGFILIYVPLFWFSIRACNGNKLSIAYTICYFLSLYQRPNWYSVLFILLLFSGIGYIREKIGSL